MKKVNIKMTKLEKQWLDNQKEVDRINELRNLRNQEISGQVLLKKEKGHKRQNWLIKLISKIKRNNK